MTGGGRGLGRAYALHLAALGADVAVLDVDTRSYRDFERESAAMTADSTALEIEALGRRALEFEADVADAAAVQAAVDAHRRRVGPPRHRRVQRRRRARFAGRVAGVDAGPRPVRRRPASATSTAPSTRAWRWRRSMKEQGAGKIVTVSSQAGRRASSDGGYAHYGAAKAAIIMYTKYLAQDLGPHGIQVNCIAPGYIGTGRLMPMFEAGGVDRLTRSVAPTPHRHAGGLRPRRRLPRRPGVRLRHRHRHPDRRRQHDLRRRGVLRAPRTGCPRWRRTVGRRDRPVRRRRA